jgi:LysR family hydrogen peroxide-inducible transcriptional activator
MAVSPPMAPDPRIALREFVSPRPHRDVTLCGRPAVLGRRAVQALISVLRDLPGGFTEPLGEAVPTEPVSV